MTINSKPPWLYARIRQECDITCYDSYNNLFHYEWEFSSFSFFHCNIFCLMKYVTSFTLIVNILGEGWILPNKHIILAEGWCHLKALFYSEWNEYHGGFFLCSLRDLLYCSLSPKTALPSPLHLLTCGLQRNFRHPWGSESSWHRRRAEHPNTLV